MTNTIPNWRYRLYSLFYKTIQPQETIYLLDISYPRIGFFCTTTPIKQTANLHTHHNAFPSTYKQLFFRGAWTSQIQRPLPSYGGQGMSIPWQDKYRLLWSLTKAPSTEPTPSLARSPSPSQPHLHHPPSQQNHGSSQHLRKSMSIPLAVDIPTSCSLVDPLWLKWPGRCYAKTRVGELGKLLWASTFEECETLSTLFFFFTSCLAISLVSTKTLFSLFFLSLRHGRLVWDRRFFLTGVTASLERSVTVMITIMALQGYRYSRDGWLHQAQY